jgi:D-alanine-D-alanine ligase
MRVLILHSDVPPDAPADEQDTLFAAQAIGEALTARGHPVALAPVTIDIETIRALVEKHRPDAVFNMVEAVFRLGELAPIVPAILEKLNVPFTGCRAAPMALAGDKPLAKRLLRLEGLRTPDWDEAPFDHLNETQRYIVKSATEDASLGLDDAAIAKGRAAVRERSAQCKEKFGGRWFAEAYIEGREFNVSVMEEDGHARVLPIPEMRFENWPADRPRLVGYAAKWEEDSADSIGTVRRFGGEEHEPELHREMAELAQACWRLFGLHGFARVDFRVPDNGRPTILEINPNPCLEPGAGFAAAAAIAGFSYAELVERIVLAGLRAGERCCSQR